MRSTFLVALPVFTPASMGTVHFPDEILFWNVVK